MAAKYNHKNTQHRIWLAQNILKILTSWGFEIDKDMDMPCHEFVLSKYHRWDPTKKIIVYTSIDKTSGAIRSVGTDAIRVVSIRLRNNDENLGLYKKRVFRTGEFKKIVNRMLDAVKCAQAA